MERAHDNPSQEQMEPGYCCHKCCSGRTGSKKNRHYHHCTSVTDMEAACAQARATFEDVEMPPPPAPAPVVQKAHPHRSFNKRGEPDAEPDIDGVPVKASPRTAPRITAPRITAPSSSSAAGSAASSSRASASSGVRPLPTGPSDDASSSFSRANVADNSQGPSDDMDTDDMTKWT